MRPGQRDLESTGGLNAHRFNAELEGGARNGVLTAIEDVMSQSRHDLRLVTVPGINGLGLLYPAVIAERRPTATEFIDRLSSNHTLLQLLEPLEDARLEAQIESIERASELKQGRREVAGKDREIDVARRQAEATALRRNRAVAARNAARDEVKHLRGSLREMRSKERIARQKTMAARAQVRRLKARIASLERELDQTQSESASAQQSYQDLSARRPVRFALRAASIAGPYFRFVPRRRSQDPSDPSDETV